MDKQHTGSEGAHASNCVEAPAFTHGVLHRINPVKICPECSTIHTSQEACPPLVQCQSCGTMYRHGKGCLVCVLLGNHMPSASLAFKKMQDEATAQESIHWLYDDGHTQIGVARQDAIITDEMHIYAEPISEQDEPVVTPLPSWLFR